MKLILSLCFLLNTQFILAANPENVPFPQIHHVRDSEKYLIYYLDRQAEVNDTNVSRQLSDSSTGMLFSQELHQQVRYFYEDIFEEKLSTFNNEFLLDNYENSGHPTVPIPQNTFLIYEGNHDVKPHFSTHNVYDCIFAYLYSTTNERVAVGHFDFTVTKEEIAQFIKLFSAKEAKKSHIKCVLISATISPLLANFYRELSNSGIKDVKVHAHPRDSNDDFVFLTIKNQYIRIFSLENQEAYGQPWNIVVDEQHNFFSFNEKTSRNMASYRNFLFGGKFALRPEAEEINASIAVGTFYAEKVLEGLKESAIGSRLLQEVVDMAGEKLSSLIDLSDYINDQESDDELGLDPELERLRQELNDLKAKLNREKMQRLREKYHINRPGESKYKKQLYLVKSKHRKSNGDYKD